MELALLKMRETLEHQVTGIDNLCIAACLVMDDLGIKPADDP